VRSDSGCVKVETPVDILVAFAIAAPFAGWVMNRWLDDFKFHINIDVWVFAISLLFTLITVVYKAFKAVLMDPVRSLQSE
jgi:hypothetical protein